MSIDDPKVQEAIRRCARAAAWVKLETNEGRKELARQELVTAKEAMRLAVEELARKKAVVKDGPDHIREIKIRG
jgi:hypothetical protein